MFCNATATLHTDSETYDFAHVYVYETTTSSTTTAGLTKGTTTMLYIPQDSTGYNLSSLTVKAGKDYFTINGGERKYTVKTIINGLFGSPGMKHLEFELS